MSGRAVALAAIGFGLLLLSCGCGSDKTIELRYDRSPEYQLPERIKKIAVAEFGGKTSDDQRWGDIATNHLESGLDYCNKKYHRFELVERKRLKGVMDERDLQMAISDTSQAVKFGALAKVDAIVYGNVKVDTRDEMVTEMVFDPLSQSLRPMPRKKRYCMASVNFTMDDINSGKTLASRTFTHDYDSRKDPKAGGSALTKMTGIGADGLPPTDRTVNALIQACVQDFISHMSPHEVAVQEKLQKGRSKFVETGNKMAVADDLKGALEMYERAIQVNPDDHGALFNAGAVCEKMQDFKKAEEYYSRAIRLEPAQQYITARQRVRGAGEPVGAGGESGKGS
jgi:tetratricopeptide (TPR) repeat protein